MVDFSKIKDFHDVHLVLKKSLNFPDYYGGHLDALYDCLTDMLGWESHIKIYGIKSLEKFDKYDKKLLEVLREAKYAFNGKFSNRFFVIIVHEDGTCEEL